jgi:hypothetical protein
MARYILVAVEDNREANTLVNVLNGTEHADMITTTTTEVVGVFFKPTQFCECTTLGVLSRGKKFGALVHACGKPIRGQWQHPRNLLVADDRPYALYENGMYLGVVEPRDGNMPTLDHKARGKALGITR